MISAEAATSSIHKFSTYAVPMILGEVRRYLRDNNSIRVSRSLRDTAYKAIYAKEQLTKSMNRTPTIEEIAKETDISEEDIKAEFKHGVLKLFVPKKEAKPAVEQKHSISIEG